MTHVIHETDRNVSFLIVFMCFFFVWQKIPKNRTRNDSLSETLDKRRPWCHITTDYILSGSQRWRCIRLSSRKQTRTWHHLHQRVSLKLCGVWRPWHPGSLFVSVSLTGRLSAGDSDSIHHHHHQPLSSQQRLCSSGWCCFHHKYKVFSSTNYCWVLFSIQTESNLMCFIKQDKHTNVCSLFLMTHNDIMQPQGAHKALSS